MGAKAIKVSSDGSTYYTLPGNTGDWTDTASVVDDTIFGQNYKSSQSDMIDWKVTANAHYKGYGGYSVTIKQQGSSTAFTNEAVTLAGQVATIANFAKSLWDDSIAIVVKDGSTDITSHVDSIDYLFGIVYINSGYTILGTITIASGHYFPLTTLAKYQKYSLTQSQASIDNSDIPTASGNSGLRTFQYGLITISLQVDGVYSITSAYHAALTARSVVVIEICPDGGGKSVARGFFKPTSRKQSGNVGALEVETMSWDLFVPASVVTATLQTPFNWQFYSTDLTVAVQKLITAFLAQTSLTVKYLPDGGLTSNAGLQGSCIVADLTLTGGIGSMNTFAVTLQGSGTVTAITT